MTYATNGAPKWPGRSITRKLPTNESPILPSDIEAATVRRLYLAGQGGASKTTWLIEAFRGPRHVVLAPEHDFGGKHRKDERFALKPKHVQTIDHYLCISFEKPIDEWDPTTLGP